MTEWKPISTAPFGRDVELQVGDRFGEHVLSFPCRLTDKGWINAELNVTLSPAVRRLRGVSGGRAGPTRRRR
jgi:hypothetical protein